MNKTTDNNKKILKIIKKISIIVGSIFIGLLILLSVVAIVFEDKIADLFLGKIYQYTSTKISHKDVSFSLIRKFPYAALEIESLIVESPNQIKEPLLIADKVYLQTNIFDLIKGDYVIRRIAIHQATMNMIINTSGKDNWHIFIKEDSTQDNEVKIAINTISLSKIEYNYHNQQKNQATTILAKKISAKGDFDKSIFTANIKSNLFIDKFINDNIVYIQKQDLDLNTLLYINTEKEIYAIENGEFDFSFLSFHLNAAIENENNDYKINGQLTTEESSIENIFSILPENIKEKTAIFKPNGLLTCTIDFLGTIGTKVNIDLNANYHLKKGKIANIQTDISFSNINFSGTLQTNLPNWKQTTYINLTSFNAKLNDGNINLVSQIKNLEAPLINFDLKAQVNLEDWQNFMPKTYIHKAEGNANISVKFNHKFKRINNLSIHDFDNAQLLGEATFSNIFLQLKADNVALSNLSGEISVDNQAINAKRLEGIIKENHFTLKGRIENIFPYIVDSTETLKIIAYLDVPHFNMDAFLQDETQTSKQETNSLLTFPQQIYFDLAFSADKVTYHNFEAQKTIGRTIFNGKKMMLKDFEINTFNGKVKANSSLIKKENEQFDINCQASLENIDISQLFYAFDNFKQNQLTNKNIRGIANSNIDFKAIMQNNIKLLENSIQSSININIKNGELLHFKPLESLSKFVALDELQNIKFATLNTTIQISDRKITIPTIDIKNNVLNLTLYGSQTFDNEIDYHISLYLSELLSKKLKNKKQQNEDFGDVVEENSNKLRLNIMAIGTLDNPKFRLDKQTSKKGFQERIKEQNDIIRQEIQNKTENDKKEDIFSNQELNNSNKKQKELELDEDW